MSVGTHDHRAQALILAGVNIPYGGENEFARLANGSFGSVVRGNTQSIKVGVGEKEATLVISCYSTDPAYAALMALANRQESTRPANFPLPGSLTNFLSGQYSVWQDAKFTAVPDVVLGREPVVGTFELDLIGATTTAIPVI